MTSETQIFDRILSYRSSIAIAGLAITLICFVFGKNLSWNATLFSELPGTNQSLLNTEIISENVGGVLPMDFAIGSYRSEDLWNDPSALNKLESFSQKWRKDERVRSLLTSVDFFKGGMKSGIKSRQSISEAQFLYGMTESNPLENYISSDGKWTRISIRTADLPADQTILLKGEITKDLKNRFPKQAVRSGGIAAVVPEVNNQISGLLMLGFFQSLFFIVLIIWVLFRNLKWALISCIPNFLPPALLIAALGFFDIPIKPGIAIVFSISLGFAFDNTIYLLSHLRKKIKDHGSLTLDLVIQTWNEEAKTCIISSLCIASGFAVFLLSNFPVNQTFGLFMLLSIIGGLFGDVIWLPCVLTKWRKILIDSPTYINLSKSIWSLEAIMSYGKRLSPIMILLALGIFSAYASAAKNDKVDSIFKNVMKRSSPPNETVSLRMVTTGPGGYNKQRTMTIMRKNNEDSKALVRIESPKDLKGVALLSISEDGKDSQYLYLPSTKKPRRILGSNKKGKFLDSEISFEDMSVSSYLDFDNKILNQNKKFVVIESRAKKDSDSSYGRIVTKIALPSYQVLGAEYYSPDGKLIKTSTFSGYKKIGGPYWRAKTLTVKSLENKRTTTLQLKSVSLKPISEDEISLESLEE